MAAELLALGDDFVHRLVGEVQRVAVFGGPAADAVHVAGTRRVKQDGPRNVAVVFFLGRVARAQAVEARLKAKVHNGRLDDIRVERVEGFVDKMHPFAVLGNQAAGIVKGFFFKKVTKQMFKNVGQARQRLLAVLGVMLGHDVVDELFDFFSGNTVNDVLNFRHFQSLLKRKQIFAEEAKEKQRCFLFVFFVYFYYTPMSQKVDSKKSKKQRFIESYKFFGQSSKKTAVFSKKISALLHGELMF